MKRRNVIGSRLLLFMIAVPAFAQTPMISGISTSADTNMVTVSYNASPASYCWVRYGVASGQYLWSSVTFQSTVCSIPIGGLQDGTTYYFLPTARPDPDDENNICATPACGAIEQVVTTPAASVSHLPASPVSVASSLLSEPDTSAYAIVNLAPTGPGGECAAQNTVGAPPGYTGTITAGQTLSQIMAANELWYGTIFQVAPPYVCIVPTSQPNGDGYYLPALPIDPLATGGSMDAPNHRWIIFRTTPGTSALPPFGFRTNPSIAANYGAFQPSAPPSENSADAFIWRYDAAGTHHYWTENLKFQTDSTQTTARWGNFFRFGNCEGGGIPPYPKYIMFAGNYINGPYRANLSSSTPSSYGAFEGSIGGNVALVGNYIDNANNWGSGNFFMAFYVLDCGTADSGVPENGPMLINNNFVGGMSMDFIEESTNSDTLTGFHDMTLTKNSFYWPQNTFSYALSLIGYGCRDQVEFKSGIRVLVRGNYHNGQWACADTGTAIQLLGLGATTDVTIASNIITNSASGIAASGAGELYQPLPRQVFGNRLAITNNLLYNLGRGPRNAGGGGAGTQFFATGTGFTNVSITNNTVIGPFATGVAYDPWIFESSAANITPMAGLKVQGNVLPYGYLNMTGSGINTRQDFDPGNSPTGQGAYSHPATPLGWHTDSWFHSGGAPTLYTGSLESYAGYTALTPNLGMQGVSVVSGGTGYPATGNLIVTGCTTTPVGGFAATNGVIWVAGFTNFGSGCNPSTMTVTADTSLGGSGAVLRAAYGLTPSYIWTGNLITCMDAYGNEMSDADCATYTGTMPSGDIYTTGGTMANRLIAAGFANYANNDFRCYPTSQSSCSAGANINQLESDLGIVSQIGTRISANSVAITYLAPDLNACSVDISPDGVNWTRGGDGGGGRERSVSFLRLMPLTTYSYRIMCYFDQSEAASVGWFSFPSDPSNLNTDGAFTTLRGTLRSPMFAFSLSSFPGADHVTMALQAIDGTQYVNTCTTSPCAFPAVPVGDYSVVESYTGGGKTWTSDPQIVNIR